MVVARTIDYLSKAAFNSLIHDTLIKYLSHAILAIGYTYFLLCVYKYIHVRMLGYMCSLNESE